MNKNTKLVEEYINQNDWRVRENSNAGFSYPSLYNHLAGSVLATYTLENLYPEHIKNAHIDGDLHIHDLSHGIVGYCAGWSLKELLLTGFIGERGRASASPAKHFSSACKQLTNFMGTLQSEFAGAQAFSSFDTYLAPFVHFDSLCYTEVKQEIQELIFELNVGTRLGQTPFTNLTFDIKCPMDMRQQPVIIAGAFVEDSFYGDFQKEMDMINMAFLEIMEKGDSDGKVFSFPIPTYNITKDFDWESPVAEKIFEVSAKYGLPTFQNFINSDLNPEDVRSLCCRLQIKVSDIIKKSNGLFGAGESTGSIGVCTLNMARLGYVSTSKVDFMQRLEKLMDVAADSLNIKRKKVEESIAIGLVPYTKRYLRNFDRHFSTIGLLGMNEACLNLFGKNLSEKESIDFTVEVLDFMVKRATHYSNNTGHLFNIESSPSEGTCYRLAKIDKKKYPKIITSGESEPYYTNSTNLPVDFTSDVFEALDLQESIQNKYTGGTVFHAYLGERVIPQQCKLLVKTICEKYKIPYLDVTPTFSICEDHKYIAGEHYVCPTCGKETQVFSRVTGYLRPLTQFNAGKQEEFKARKTYKV